MGMSTSCAAAAAAGLQGELELGVGEVCTPECARIRCQEACKPVCPEAHIPLDKEYACENDQDAPNAVVLQQWPKKPGVLEIHFKLPDHSAKVVEFNKTPLGLEFTRTHWLGDRPWEPSGRFSIIVRLVVFHEEDSSDPPEKGTLWQSRARAWPGSGMADSEDQRL
eukprot:TRINITY_DN14891_c0_g1_i1.p1 TRINITY_DN14891_c0_g1~~TRINITY_DN14891_c0_g1_i1.p1  ORF type:complete len:166 (+),score=28.22 TRINITY_DN14891_c0_g1_i1:26-523(+)